jgi:hypothetical protein
MMRVISSPSISTTVPATLILSIVTVLVSSPFARYSIGAAQPQRHALVA